MKCSHSKGVRTKALYPYIISLRSVPIVVIAPLTVIWFGYTIFASALTGMFPLLINGIAGLKSADPTMLELMHSFNASRWQVLSKAKIFNAMPYVFAALKASVGLSVIGAVVGE